jgi:uncharacterized Rmd1/YagE family protein
MVPMQASGYCTANNYDFKSLEANLKSKYKVKTHGLEAMHFPYKDGTVCLFSYGCVTFWDLTEKQAKEFLQTLKQFENGSIEPHYHLFDYKIDIEYKVSQDIITLSNQMPIEMQKLAVSYGISQSMKLSVFESRIDSTIDQTRYIPEELARTGRISMSRKQLSKQIGGLFLERNSINLHTDILDTPGFFWDHPEYDPIYIMTIKDLDLKSRTAVLNTRLDIIRELFDVLKDALNNRHATMLEWVIIILISIEVVISLFAHFYK